MARRSTRIHIGPVERDARYMRVLDLARALGPLKRRTRAKRIIWTPPYDDLLGQATDKDLAKEWKVDYSALWWRRRIINRQAFVDSGGGSVVWTAQMVKALGVITDGEVARRFSLSTRSVVVERTRRGIAPCYQRRNCLRLGGSAASLLGIIPDKVLAKTWGWNRNTVGEERRRRGIPTKCQWRVAWDDPKVRGKLGKMPDRALARELGLAYPSVRKWRIKLGIPVFQGSRRGR